MPAGRAEDVLSPAEQKIAAARKVVERSPADVSAYNDLALAHARRARETGDPSHYDRAREAVAKALELAPGDFTAQRTEVWLLLGKHEFARALERAKALNKMMPDDVMVYGFLTDAHVELGHYKEAEESAQWMLDLRPGNVPAYTRAEYLRELFGDIEGALELMEKAYGRTPATETEDRAWTLTQMAHLHLQAGKLENAEFLLNEALRLFPAYHYALANLAKVRQGQGRHLEAVELLRRRYAAAPHPENLYELAAALARAGRAREASTAFARFEREAVAESQRADNANHELVFYYTDYAHRPADALRIATLEVERRRDAYTLDAYAWALNARGRHAEARRQIETALAVGVRDPRILYHAGEIALRQGDRAAAIRYFRASLDQSGRSEVARAAREALAGLARPKNSAAP